MDRTLCIFKPDLASSRFSNARAMVHLLATGFFPIRLQRMTLTKPQAMRLYATHEGQSYYRRNVEFMASGPSVVMVLEGDRAVERLRKMVGSTDPKQSPKGTLRQMFGTDLPRNAVHATTTQAEVDDEIRIFFND